MRRFRTFALAAVVALMSAASFNATASWQGTWLYYDDEGVLVGSWTAGCREMDGRWGVETSNKVFVQGCRASS
ncbi:DUF6289 family protein [Lysobacter sp. LF1]|uniref:DUF6289 family protein n=1 Tax=Lysobacter stagni TaxID=3045172 RepID=A0ABT6XGC5_9GAMM|nr:DUF6289 family protein [Lysobacter sp. LF1]MDI9239201.1 DUF6289 family protein [Lysobacter sp. LF1]